MGRTKANKQVPRGNKRSSWFKERLVDSGKVLQTTEQKNNSNAKLPKYYHNVTWESRAKGCNPEITRFSFTFTT